MIDDERDETEPGERAERGSRRRRLGCWLPVLLLAGLLGACGGDGGDADAPASEADLRAGLLAVDDLPPGSTEFDAEQGDDGEAFCDLQLSKLLAVDSDELTSARTSFTLGDGDDRPLDNVVGFVPPGRGADVVPAVRVGLSDCEPEPPEGAGDVEFSEVPLAPLGDAAIAFRGQVEELESGSIYTFATAYATRGDLVVIVTTFDFENPGNSLNLLKRYAPLAVDKAVGALARSS